MTSPLSPVNIRKNSAEIRFTLPVSLKVFDIIGCIRPIKRGAAYLLLAIHISEDFLLSLSKFERTNNNNVVLAENSPQNLSAERKPSAER